MRQMHLQNGQKKDCPPKLNGRNAVHGMKKSKSKTIFPWGNQSPSSDHANLFESYQWSPIHIGFLSIWKKSLWLLSNDR